MLDICSICLRTGIELTLEETLQIFFIDLCGIEFDGNYLFCPTCAHLLRKFYNFRNKCHKAYHVMKNWNKESKITRIPINKLYTELPPTSLGVSKDCNRAIYCYNYSEENTESNSDLNSYFGNNTKFIKQKTDKKSKEKDMYKMALQNQLVNDSLILFSLPTVDEESKTEQQDLDDDLNKYDTVIHDDDDVIHYYDDVIHDDGVDVKNNDDVIHNNDDVIYYYDDDVKHDDDVVIKNEDHENDNVIYYYDDDVKHDDEVVIQNDDDVIHDDDVVIHNDDHDYHDVINMKEVSNKRKNYMELTEDAPEKKICKLFPDPMLDIDLEVSNKRKSTMELSKDEPEKIIYKTFPDLTFDKDLEETKRNVKKKLKNGDVRDKDGNVIEVEVIVNNLHKLHKSIYTRVQTSCAGDEPLTPEAIEVLSRIQNQYGTLYSSVFITKHLTTDEEIMQVFRERETNQNYVQSEHKCTRCFKHFKSTKMLENHIVRFHDPSNPHKCRYCDVTFSRRKLLWRHTQTHRVVYQCKLCPLVTNYISVVDSHTNIHTGSKYRCTKCSAVFKSRTPLAAHMNSMHAVNLICPYCARQFISKTGLRQHKQLKHRNVIDTVGPPSAKCEECNMQFISDEVYLEHQRKSHDGPPKERGPCRKRTPCPNPKTPKYTCRVCKHIEPSMGALIRHFKSAHPDEEFDLSCIALRDTYKYLCHLCGKGFWASSQLTDHKNMHTGVRPYTCTECPKAFHSKHHLTYHMKFHGPPTHQCDQCEKKFHNSANLSNHKRLHTGDRRYACELCGKTFLHQGSVNAHVRGVHQHIRRKKKHTKQTTMNTE